MNSQTIRRIFRYIFRGIPVQFVTAKVSVEATGQRLRGKHVLVTGGSRGIGLAIARKCIAEGARVLICGRDTRVLEDACGGLGSACCRLSLDVSSVGSIPGFLDEAFAMLDGRIDCLVSNAGISYHEADFRHVTESGFDEQFGVNFKGAYFLAKYYVAKLEKEQAAYPANILFITSERGSFCTDIPYGLSKTAVDSLTGALSNRLYASHDIRVNALAPGVTVSDMTGRKADDNLASESSPAGRFFLPEEMAEVACFLLSDLSRCISGEVIHCDAGAHLKCI